MKQPAISLITFLGGNRGKEPNKPVYKPTKYQFDDSFISENSAYFGGTLVCSQRYPIQQVLVLGSRTSIWEHLVQEDNEDLYLHILEKTEGDEAPGITNEQLESVQNILAERWQVKVFLYAGEVGVTKKNALQELMNYEKVLELIPPDHEVLLDFTHSFRSMPILLMSALRFRAALTGQKNLRDIQLIYGELSGDISSVHVLDDIWTGMKVAQAARLFFEKFEGEELAAEVKEVWPNGAKAILNFSKAIQANLFYRIEDSLLQLRNQTQIIPENSPQWLYMIVEKIKELQERVLENSLPKTLLKLAKELMAKQLPGQAFIALDEAMTEVVLAAHQKDSKDLSFKDLNKLLKETLDGIQNNNLKNQLRKIHHTRNAVAHAWRQTDHLSKSNSVPQNNLQGGVRPLAEVLEPLVNHPERLFQANS